MPPKTLPEPDPEDGNDAENLRGPDLQQSSANVSMQTIEGLPAANWRPHVLTPSWQTT